MARQDPWHRCLTENRSAEHIYSLEAGTAQMGLPCQQNAWYMLTKETLLWRISSGKPILGWPRDTLQGHHKNLPQHTPSIQETLKETTHDQTKWYCLIRKGAQWLQSKGNLRSWENASSGKPELLSFLWLTGLLFSLKMPRNPASENVVCLCHLLHLLANFFKIPFAYRQTVWTQIRLLQEEQSDLGPHCLQQWLLK